LTGFSFYVVLIPATVLVSVVNCRLTLSKGFVIVNDNFTKVSVEHCSVNESWLACVTGSFLAQMSEGDATERSTGELGAVSKGVHMEE
jgi:hypothetical protein